MADSGPALAFRYPDPPPLPKWTRRSVLIIAVCVSFALPLALGMVGALIAVILAYPMLMALLRFATHMHEKRWRDQRQREFASAWGFARQGRGRVMHLPQPPDVALPPEEAAPKLPEMLRDPAWDRAGIECDVYRVHARDVGMDLISAYWNGDDHDKEEWFYSHVSQGNRLRIRALRVYADRAELAELAEVIGAAHGGYDLDDIAARPELERPAVAETDCRNGHYGLMDMGEIITGRDGQRRVRRSCGFCESQWSDLA